MIPVIETERLNLRPWTLDDAAALAANMTPEVTRWLASWPDNMTPEFAAGRLAKVIADMEAGREVSWAIVRKADGRLIGGIGFHLGGFPIPGREADTHAEVGYHLAEGLHGQGLMSEAAIPALAAAWELLPTVRVMEAGLLPGNAGSAAILTKLGMTRVHDRIIYSPARNQDELCWCFEVGRG